MTEPDVKRRARLIFLSYRFSQGGFGAQNRLLLHLEAHYAPGLFAPAGLPAVRRMVRRLVAPYFLNDALHPAAAVGFDNGAAGAVGKSDGVVVDELAGLFGRFDRREELRAFSADPVALASTIVWLDDGYLARPNGRASGDDRLRVVRRGGVEDPWRSVFVEHALLGRGTGDPAYDALFATLAGPAVLAGLDEQTRRARDRIVATYAQRHPRLDEGERRRLIASSSP